MNRFAIIDLGTNTFNLLIIEAEGKDYRQLFATKIGVGLGLGGINENRISDDAKERGIKALGEFERKCAEYNVNKIKAIGTSALRNADNAADFVESVKETYGIDIEIINGAREAELIHRGNTLGYKIQKPTLIMDIGGGSTEFVFCNENGIIKSKSFEIGVARILQMRDFNDPFSNADIAFVEEYLEEHLGVFFQGMTCEVLMGSSGSFETLYAMHFNEEYPENNYTELKGLQVQLILEEIIASTLEERKAHPNIIPIRQLMLPIAAIKVNYVLEKLMIKQIIISPNSLKEGVIDSVIL